MDVTACTATLPPPGEPGGIQPIRSAVHQLDHRVTDAFSGPAAAEHFGQRALSSGRIAEAQEHDSHVSQRAEAGILLFVQLERLPCVRYRLDLLPPVVDRLRDTLFDPGLTVTP